MNVEMGYSIDLTLPWHWSDCASGTVGSGAELRSRDIFVAVSDYDLAFGDLGLPYDHISVSARSNPQGLTPRQWYEAGMIGTSTDDSLSDVTFAGRPALRVASRDAETYVVAQDERMFEVSGQPFDSNFSPRDGQSTPEQRAAVMSTFRFLSSDEIAAAKAIATPAPSQRRPEEVADVLADGFAKKDVAILATVITASCITQGFWEGGASAMDERRFLDELADRFREGLVVEVRPRPITDMPGNPGTVVIGSIWREPRNPDAEVDLMLSADGERWYWRGQLFYPGGRR